MNNFFHILSLNVQGIRNKDKRYRLKEYIKMQRVEILFIQETHFTIETTDLLKREFDELDIL